MPKLVVEREKVKDYLNGNALHNWVRPLNGPKCTHDPTRVNPSFGLNRSQEEDWASVLTEWKIIATNPLPNNDYSRALLLEIFLFQYPRLKPPALAGQLSATTLQADSDAL